MTGKGKEAITRMVYTAILVVVILIAGLAAGVYYYYGRGGTQPTQKVLKVAYVDVVPSSSSWWITNQLAITDAVTALNTTDYPITLDFYSGVSQTNEPQLIESLAQSNYSVLIIDASLDLILNDLGPKYPNTQFILQTQVLSPTQNVGVVNLAIYCGYYAAGLAAAYASKTHTIGFITAFKVTGPLASAYNAYVQGANAGYNGTNVLLQVTNDWSDGTKGAAAVDGLVALGADVVAPCGDGMSSGAMAEAQNKGIYSIGYLFNATSVAPNSIMFSIVWNAESSYHAIIDLALKGALSGRIWSLSILEGSTGFVINDNAMNKALTPAQLQNVTAAIAMLENGTLSVPNVEVFP